MGAQPDHFTNLVHNLITPKTTAEVFWWADPPGVTIDPGLTLWGVGVREAMPPVVCRRPDGMRVGYLIMCFHDSVDLSSGGSEQRYPADHLVAWTPECPHTYGRADRAWLHSWVIIDGPTVGALLAEAEIPVNTPLPLSSPAPVDDSLRLIGAEVLRYASPDPVILRASITIWLREVARLMRGSSDCVAPPTELIRLRRFIDGHFAEPLTLERLAWMVNLSVPHFCREFKRHFGISAIAYVIQCRMRRAAYLLHNPYARVGEVAAAVGYDDARHFSRLFRKHYGVSARQMREVVHDKSKALVH